MAVSTTKRPPPSPNSAIQDLYTSISFASLFLPNKSAHVNESLGKWLISHTQRYLNVYLVLIAIHKYRDPCTQTSSQIRNLRSCISNHILLIHLHHRVITVNSYEKKYKLICWSLKIFTLPITFNSFHITESSLPGVGGCRQHCSLIKV